MKVVLWGTYDTGKPRIRILREGLRRNGVDVVECHASVWEGIEDKSGVGGPVRRLRLALRWLAAYPALLIRYLRLPRHDMVLVSYPGFLDALLIRPFASLRGVSVVWDVFMSVHDTIVDDRRLMSPGNPIAKLLWAVEWLASRAAHLAFLDTAAHARRFEAKYRLAGEACAHVWVGAETEHFAVVESSADAGVGRRGGDRLKVLFYGQFIPLHGVPVIVEAARLLQHEAVDWLLVGTGQEAAAIKVGLEADPLPALRWIEWVDYRELRCLLADTDVCLGIFGTSDKADSVIPNKIFQALAAGCPVVTRDSTAIREILSNEPPCVQLIVPGDAQALADAIRTFSMSTRRYQRCHSKLQGRLGAAAIGHDFLKMLKTANM